MITAGYIVIATATAAAVLRSNPSAPWLAFVAGVFWPVTLLTLLLIGVVAELVGGR